MKEFKWQARQDSKRLHQRQSCETGVWWASPSANTPAPLICFCGSMTHS